MRCARCGNDNPGTNRFCGMCGATLLRPPVRAPQSTAHSTAPPAPPVSSATTPAAAPAAPVATPPPPAHVETPAISGPSFLGLNEPARQAEPRSAGSLSIDPSSAPSSRSLDYLLEEEHEPASGGAVKYILILLALALAVGLGYLRFKNQGLAWLKGSTAKPPAAQSSDAPDSTSTPPLASGSANPAPASGKTPPSATATPTTTDLPSSSPASTSSATVPAGLAPAATPPAASTSPDATAPADTPANPAPKPAPKAPRAKDLSDPNAIPVPIARPKPAAATPKPTATAAPAIPLDPVVEAQNYIYGRGGVRQDCDRGLRILKPSADQSNPKAMVEMGALYSAGLCTPRDLPTAYRWFALALRKDPDNQAVQTDLQKLWGEMTQPERQLAIKLSQ